MSVNGILYKAFQNAYHGQIFLQDAKYDDTLFTWINAAFLSKKELCYNAVYRSALTWFPASSSPPSSPFQDLHNSGLIGKYGWLRPWLI